jgi:hypothetical protein
MLTTLGLGLGGAITLLYVLRVRRRRIEVPFSPLWQKVLQTRQATSLWDKLKRLVSLLVQLLLLALVLLALGNPRRQDENDAARAVVLLLDTSASMATDDEQGGRTRIQEAQRQAEALLQTLTPRDEVMLVRFDHTLRPLTPFTRDFDAVQELVGNLTPTGTGGSADEALRFAAEALDGRPGAEIVLLSDGVFGELDGNLEIDANVKTTWLQVGEDADNVSISAFNVRRYPANRTNYEVLVAVQNHSDKVVEVRLDILGEGSLVQTERLTLAAGERRPMIYTDLPAAGAHLQARVEVVGGDIRDSLSTDDVAWTLLPRDRMTRVLLVSNGNLYLEGALLLNESLDTTRMTPAAYANSEEADASAEYDVTIFDGVAPATSGRGNFMYFSPTGPDSPWEVDADVAEPIIHSTRSNHPLLHYVGTLRDVNISRARRLQTTSDDVVVASAIGGAPMIVARSGLAERLIGVAFHPSDSDFPLRVAFPVMVLNAIDWFLQEDARLVDSWSTGESWNLRMDDRSATEATVTRPDGGTEQVPAYDGVVVYSGDQPGYYEVAAGSDTVEIAANLLNDDESAMRAPVWPDAFAERWARELPDGADYNPFDPWFLMVAAAFGLLMLEWFTWNRRWTV